MLVAFDFGISNTDIAVFQNEKTTFHSIPSKHKIIIVCNLKTSDRHLQPQNNNNHNFRAQWESL